MRLVRPLMLFLVIGLAFAVTRTSSASNGGSAVCVLPQGLRFPFAQIAEPDSGALILFADTRTNAIALYAQRLDRHGHAMWTPGGVLVSSNPGVNWIRNVISDGSGGVIAGWQENRGATGQDVVLQRILANGTLGYSSTGIVICNATADQGDAQLVPGGPGGSYYVVWQDMRNNPSNADIYAQCVTIAGVPQWTANGVLVNTVAQREAGLVGGGDEPTSISDMQGGLIVTWVLETGRTPVVQRLNSAGTLLWGGGGSAVTVGTTDGYFPTIAADGLGGVWVVSPHELSPPNNVPYLQHVLAAGTLGFASPGVDLQMGLTGGQFDSYSAYPVRDASGGCMVYGVHYYSGNTALSRQQVSSGGALLRGSGEDPTGGLSGSGGLILSDLGGSVGMAYTLTALGRTRLQFQRFAYDGTALLPGGGVSVGRDKPVTALLNAAAAGLANGVTMIAFSDTRYCTPNNPQNFQAFAECFDSAGNPIWDDSELPALVSAPDAPSDQGGYVRLNWNPGIADAPGAGVVTEYRAWRSVSAPMALELARQHPASAEEGTFSVQGRTFLTHADAYWEMVASEPAAELSGYALTVPTGQDSMAGSPANEQFMVEALDDSSDTWFSGVLQSHSVDNLAPPAIASAAGYYATGSTTLYWGGVAVADLCCYDVFRGGSPGFVPSLANRVGETSDVTLTDVAGGPAWYRIAARDIHGNLGPSALVMPNGTTAVDGTAPREWKLGAAWQRGAGVLALALDVPGADAGRIELFDVTGRRLWSAPFTTAGAASLTLNVGAREAVLPSGVVFARARANSGRTLNTRAVVIR